MIFFPVNSDSFLLETRRKRPENARDMGTVFRPECLRIFPLTSNRFPPERTRSWSEISGKIRRHSGSEYCFQVSSIFTAFLPESARTPSPGLTIKRNEIFFFAKNFDKKKSFY